MGRSGQLLGAFSFFPSMEGEEIAAKVVGKKFNRSARFSTKGSLMMMFAQYAMQRNV